MRPQIPSCPVRASTRKDAGPLPSREMRTFVARSERGVALRGRDVEGPTTRAPALLLHHGLASSQHIWDGMLPHLTRQFRVVTYDARGHGVSGKPTSGYGFDHVVADALAVMRDRGLRRPVLVGHSWGAMVAMELAARHPRAIAGAVLVDGGFTSLSSTMDWPTAKARLAPPVFDGLRVDDLREGFRRRSPIPLSPAVEGMFVALMHVDAEGRIRPRLSRANHFRILRAIWEQDPIALARTLRVPALVIAASSGDPEEREFMESKRRAARALRDVTRGKDVRVTWMRGVHDLPLQHPAALARRVSRFAAEVVE
jgi:pimeloyl-ACP methyl ester carboxylesterase